MESVTYPADMSVIVYRDTSSLLLDGSCDIDVILVKSRGALEEEINRLQSQKHIEIMTVWKP